MTLHLKSRGYPFRPRLLFSSFIVVGFGSPNCVLFQERTESNDTSEESNDMSEEFFRSPVENKNFLGWNFFGSLVCCSFCSWERLGERSSHSSSPT